MISREKVRAAMYFRLDADNRVALVQAGSDWEDSVLGDFYALPDQVTRAMIQVMKSSLPSQTDLAPDGWQELANEIDRTTGVRAAINTEVDASRFERPMASFFA